MSVWYWLESRFAYRVPLCGGARGLSADLFPHEAQARSADTQLYESLRVLDSASADRYTQLTAPVAVSGIFSFRRRKRSL